MEQLPRRIAIQCENLGAGDTVKVAGRVGGAVVAQPVQLTKVSTGALIPGGTGIVADPDEFQANVSGLDVELQFTKVTNNPIVNWSDNSF